MNRRMGYFDDAACLRIVMGEDSIAVLRAGISLPVNGLCFSLHPSLLPAALFPLPPASYYPVGAVPELAGMFRLPLPEGESFALYATVVSALCRLAGEDGEAFLPRRGVLITPAFYRLLNDSYHENRQLGDYAAAAGVSREHLCREFRRMTGWTLGTYLWQMRLYRAALDLLDTDKSISAVLYDNGFSCAAAFYRAFGDYFGTSPAVYRGLYHNFLAQNLCL